MTNTIATRRAFNARSAKARLSAGWAHDARHFHFQRQHDSDLPFADDRPSGRTTLGDKAVAIAAIVGAIAILIIELF